VLVAPMIAHGGVEMLLGLVHDEQFGPLVVLGFGGIHAEILRDVVALPLSIDAEDVRVALARLKGVPLLRGVRGRPPADVEALVDVLVRLARFATDHADALAEIDLNPVIVHAVGEGVSVVDALVVKQEEGR